MIFTLKKGANESSISEVWSKISILKSNKALNAKKYCGILKISEEPLKIQKRLRNEWQ